MAKRGFMLGEWDTALIWREDGKIEISTNEPTSGLITADGKGEAFARASVMYWLNTDEDARQLLHVVGERFADWMYEWKKSHQGS